MRFTYQPVNLTPSWIIECRVFTLAIAACAAQMKATRAKDDENNHACEGQDAPQHDAYNLSRRKA